MVSRDGAFGILIGAAVGTLFLVPLPASAQLWERTQVEKWTRDFRIDVISDSRDIKLTLVADEGVNDQGEPILLFVGCRGGGIYTEVYFGMIPGLWMTTTFDYDRPERKVWIVSPSDYQGMRPPPFDAQGRYGSQLGNAVFLTALLNSERFVARIEPDGKRPVTALFDTYGLRRALGGLRVEACGLPE